MGERSIMTQTITTSNDEFEIIFRPYITIKGKRIYARQKGLSAFPIKVKKGQKKQPSLF